MRYLRFFPVVVSTIGIASLLVGCPQGAGVHTSGQDGGDAGDGGPDLDGSVDDADGHAEPSTGALCGINGLNRCGEYMSCSLTLGCVECLGDHECALTAPTCLLGRCEGCRPGIATSDGGAAPDCPDGTACWVSDYQCHPRCFGTGTCPGGLRCDDASGECVGCSSNDECVEGVCSMATRVCVECTTNDTCPRDRPRCRVAEGTCVACLSNDDCGRTAPICDPTTFTCRRGCSSDAQCPGQRCIVEFALCADLPPPEADASTDGG